VKVLNACDPSRLHRGRSVRGNSYQERQDGNKRRAREAMNCNTIKEGGLTSERSERWLDRQLGASSGKRTGSESGGWGSRGYHVTAILGMAQNKI
jgi:hypothetical protein